MEKIEIQDESKQRCPKCKNRDLEFESYEFVDELIKQNATCKKCDFNFTYWADKPKFWEVFGKL